MADVDASIDYLLINWSTQVAEDYIANLERHIFRISNNPNSFPCINATEKIRKCVISWHHTIYYLNEMEHIEILRIFDTRQRPIKYDE